MNRARRPRSPSASTARAFRTGRGRADRRIADDSAVRRDETWTNVRGREVCAVGVRSAGDSCTATWKLSSREDGIKGIMNRQVDITATAASVASSHFWLRGSTPNVGLGRFSGISGAGASADQPSPGVCMAGGSPKRAPARTAEPVPAKSFFRRCLSQFRRFFGIEPSRWVSLQARHFLHGKVTLAEDRPPTVTVLSRAPSPPP